MSALPALPSRLTHLEANGCLAACEAALRQASGSATLDARALQTFDSSAVAVLLALARAAQARGVELQLQGMPQRLRELCRLYGVAEMLPG